VKAKALILKAKAMNVGPEASANAFKRTTITEIKITSDSLPRYTIN